MTSNFKERFQGKINSIPKQGITNVLNHHQTQPIYTNTDHSFRKHQQPKYHLKTNLIEGQPSSAKQNCREEKQSLHLPSIGNRYLSHQSKITPASLQQNKYVGYFDKQTNWLIEEKVRASSPLCHKQNANSAHILQTLKDSLLKRLGSKQSSYSNFSRKSNSFSKPIKLGGLGPDIGGDEWTIRHKKQEKALDYAKKIRKIHRKRINNENQDSYLTGKIKKNFVLQDLYND